MGDYGSYGGYDTYGNEPAAGATGAASGGFMTNSPGVATSPSRSTRTKRVDTVTSVTIKQLLKDTESQNDSFVLEGREIGKCWISGRVVKIDTKQAQINYTVDDGTGQIECVTWINESTDTTRAQEKREMIKTDMYVKVLGQMRTFNNKRTLTSFCVNPILDSNELVHHYLSVIATHIEVTKGPLNPKLVMQKQNVQSSSPGHTQNDELSSLQRLVLNAFQEQIQTDNGKSISQVAQTLQSQNVSEADIRKTIQELQEDGYLYSTINDEHYKSTIST